MNIKYLISNLLDLSKSASFVLIAFFSFVNVNQADAYYTGSKNETVCQGLPTSAESGKGGSSGSGSGSSGEGSSTGSGSGSSSTTGK